MKSLFKILVVLVFLLTGFQSAKAAGEYTCPHDSTHKCVDLKGYAWGADNSPFGGVGWISFQNTGSVDYGVYYDRGVYDTTTETYSGGGNLYGYAWSERYGYIKFGGFTDLTGTTGEADPNDFPNANGCVNNSESTANCNVKLVQSGAGYQMVGYARFCFVYEGGCGENGEPLRPNSERGGYDGWIAFKGSNFAVSYSTSGNQLQGYAWGGGSANVSNAQYGSGSGWIKLNPTGGGVSCDVPAPGDCLDDKDKPVITITASPNPVSYNGDVTLSWTITNIPNGCTADTSSNPTNTVWDGYTPTGGSLASGSKNVGTISSPTTFTISCTNPSNKTATADVLVNIEAYTPQLTLTAPATRIYGENATLDYTITNIPYGCSAQLYNNAVAVGSAFTVNGDGTTTFTESDSIVVNNLTTTSNWELKCTDSTAPSPARTGSATAKTIVTVPTPVFSFNVKDTSTNSTTSIPCTNSGVTITYSTKDVKPGSCRATINMSGSDGAWGSSTTITENDYPTTHTVTTGAVTQTGGVIYRLQCEKLDGTPATTGQLLSRSCTAGTLAVSSAASCVTPSDYVSINYSGSGLVQNSCEVSWRSAPNNKINQGSFSLRYAELASTLTVGQTYTYTVSNCQDSSNPNGARLSQSVDVEVQNSCGTATTVCGPGSSSNRCVPGKGPTFTEF